MQINFHPGFEEMDALSQSGRPFFFMVDFGMENILIFQHRDLAAAGILVDFKNFKHHKDLAICSSSFDFQAFPERIASYEVGFNLVKNHLYRGNSYLVNYTRSTLIESSLSLESLFYLAKAPYKVLYKDEFVFFSPETFVEIKDHVIYTHPMKGTIDASIENAPEILRNDEKEKAEHYTVVDLLRNDLSMVADDVTVKEFQRIDLIKTQQKNLYAMSSEISGRVKIPFRGKIGSILRMLLPAGSILGAPKEKTRQIIRESEGYERGWYTGVCGWFDGKNLDSCVMIRFIEKSNGQLYFKSGGGITHMSRLEDEYQEMKNKIYVPVY